MIIPNGPVWYFNRFERWHPQSISGEPDTVYWRQTGDYTQFWLYYARDRSPLPWRGGHPHDWELVQFDRDLCVLSQHGRGKLISVRGMRTVDDRPCIWVALGKHSNWARPGVHYTGGTDCDIALGNGRTLSQYRLEPAPDNGWADRRFGTIAAPGRTLAWRNPVAWGM